MYAIRVRVTEGDGGVDAAAAGIDDAIDDSFASLQNTQGDAAADNNGEALEDLPAQVPFTAGNPLVEHITGIVHLYRRVPTREEAEAAARAGGQAASSSSSASSSSAATATTAASSTAAAAALASLNEEADSDQLCILSLPDDLAVADLCAFLGRHLAKVRAVRLVRRAPAEAPVPAAAPAAVAAAAAAPSVSDATAADKAKVDNSPLEALHALAFDTARAMMRWQSLALFRIAIAEASHRPRIAALYRTEADSARNSAIATQAERLAKAGLISEDDVEQFSVDLLALLRGGLYYDALVGRTQAPTKAQIAAHARAATLTAIRAYAPTHRLDLHPPPPSNGTET